MKKKGQASTGLTNLLIFAVLALVAIKTFGMIDTQTASVTPSTSTAAYNAARGNFSGNTYAAYQTLSVGPTVIAAVAVLGVVLLLTQMGRK